MNLLVCLGGTGQLVLHYYLQAYLLNQCASVAPLRAVVIDQDDLNQSLEYAQEFFSTLSASSQFTDDSPAPWVRRFRVNLPAEDMIVSSLLKSGNPSPTHPAEAFLDKASLNQSVNQGFYARPCLVPLFWGRVAHELNEELARACSDVKGRDVTRIVVTGSVLGGAGGGLLMPVLEQLKAAVPNANISVVLFDQYFSFAGMKDEVRRRFRSNANGVLKTMLLRFQERGAFGIHRCVILRGDLQRDQQQEKAGKRLDWPVASSGNPFAEACYAIDHLFADTAMERPTKPEELQLSGSEIREWWARLETAKEKALNGVAFLVNKDGIERLAADPFAPWVWGKRIPNTLVAAWSSWIQFGDDRKFNRFPSLVNLELKRLWNAGDYSLYQLFPRTDIEPNLASLYSLAATLPSDVRVPKVANVPRWCATNMLFHLLRGAAA